LPFYGNSPYDAVVAVELLRNKQVDMDQLITHVLPLTEAQQGFSLVAGSDRSIKVILKPHGYE
jgi:threonine dehydrogenase-like Zn-dependent dehydrogenase